MKRNTIISSLSVFVYGAAWFYPSLPFTTALLSRQTLRQHFNKPSDEREISLSPIRPLLLNTDEPAF